MFRIILFFFAAIILFSGCGSNENNITISGAFALYPLAVKWRKEYKKLHPAIRIDIVAGGAGKGMADALSENMDLGMVSRDINLEEKKKGAYEIAVTKDAVLPTCNANNPAIKTILQKGLTKEDFQNIYLTSKYKTWGDVLKNGDKDPVLVYTRADAAGAPESWAKYLGKKQEDLLGIGIFGDPGIAEAVKKDIFSIGFNNLTYVFDQHTKKTYPGIKVLPIDINSNGQIDPDENFYENFDSLKANIINGKYPSPPARPLYFVSHGKPKDKNVKGFLKWVLTDGQKYVEEAGFIKLSDEILKEQLKKIE